ncbi:MAG: acyl-CoA dehydrogenase family protein [Hyphomicrobiales bacterium]|nr:acyl-CoA dehydrogenase family protein [Hyphomicrobiales bacterium]
MSEADEIQRMLRDSAADYIGRTDIAASVRGWRHKAPGFDRARWREMAELGWVGLRASEQFGGAGLGLSDAVALLSETGRGIGPEPLSAVGVLVVRAIGDGDNDDAKKDLLPTLCDGSQIVAAAWQERAGQMAAGECVARAERSGDSWRLSGEKDFIHAAAAADGFLIAARAKEGVGLFYAPADANGLTLETRWFTDGTSCGRLRLANAEIPAAHVVASPAAGEAALDAALDETRVAACAEMLGCMKTSLDMTLDYLRQRKQFGKAIGSFQALQHRAVDLYVQTELARSAIDRAVRILASGADSREKAMAASACKSRVSDGALLIAKESIQMHGAIGYTDEHNIGLYVRRALKLAAWLGNSAQHRKRYAALAPALELV